MNAIERREEIMRILIVRRHETMQVLAAEFGVTDRTIRNDITILTAKYPLKVSRGIGGGVEHQQTVIKQILAAFGSNTYRTCKA